MDIVTRVASEGLPTLVEQKRRAAIDAQPLGDQARR
jgi:hypothetical protein